MQETPADPDDDPAQRARTFVLENHDGTVETVLRCADAVAAEWDGEPTDGNRVADLLRAELEATGAWARLPDVLAGAARAADLSLAASPVANPPYVTATSRGPMLRATVSDGRLVVLLQAFAIERAPTRYVREAATPDEAVRASFK